MTFAPLAVPAFPIWPAADLTRPMLSMMNVRFAVTSVNDPIPSGWHQVMIDHQSRLIENERVLPRAYVPRHTRGGEMNVESDFADSAWIDGIGDTDNGAGTIRFPSRDEVVAYVEASRQLFGTAAPLPAFEGGLAVRSHPVVFVAHTA